jgi:hypothetical protein
MYRVVIDRVYREYYIVEANDEAEAIVIANDSTVSPITVEPVDGSEELVEEVEEIT